jgi:hypothetical protein
MKPTNWKREVLLHQRSGISCAEYCRRPYSGIPYSGILNDAVLLLGFKGIEDLAYWTKVSIIGNFGEQFCSISSLMKICSCKLQAQTFKSSIVRHEWAIRSVANVKTWVNCIDYLSARSHPAGRQIRIYGKYISPFSIPKHFRRHFVTVCNG